MDICCSANPLLHLQSSPSVLQLPDARQVLPVGRPHRRLSYPSSPPLYSREANQPTHCTRVSSRHQRATCLVNSTGPSRSGNRRNEARGRPPAAPLFDFLEDSISRTLDPFPLHPSLDPDHVLSGNFAPVDEMMPTPCRVVKGSIPPCLRGGAYVRIGPNPRHRPRGPYHQFDGDGMIHSLLLPGEGEEADGPLPIYCSRYVHTQKHAVESKAGGPVLPNLVSLRGLAGAARMATFLVRAIASREIDLRMGMTPTNANLFLFGDRLLALGDADFPYHVYVSPEDGDISTVGRWEIDGKFFRGMAAHPKVDKDTGEVFAIRYGFLPPFLSYFWFDGEGRRQPDVPIRSVPRLSLFHDFAVTDNYAVLVDPQMVVDPLGMVFGGGQFMFRFDPAKVPRVGLLLRRAVPGDEPLWFEVSGFNPLHVLNAWEEGDSVFLVASNWFNMAHLVDRIELVYCHMEMIHIDLGEKIITRTPLSTEHIDLGSINPAYLGRKSRYAYLAIGAGEAFKIKGVVKLDLKLAEERRDCVVAKREYGPGCFGGEPLFVAKGGEESKDEDDGYLLTYVHDENKGESRFVVMDAKSPELETVAEVALPRRVPYGFHGIFLDPTDLRGQRPPPTDG